MAEASPSSPINLIEVEGDLFDAEPESVLIHACNCVGSWGGGIATTFKAKYPEAFKVYQGHCKENNPSDLVGTALLIAPCERQGPSHWIGCVFTSKRYGRNKDSKDMILQATKTAMEDLLQQIAQEGKLKIGKVSMCRINYGMFKVPWSETKDVLRSLDVDMKGMITEIHVVRPPGEPL
jgi:ADP-ribose 1''-phosphate phosphatase